MVHRMLPSLRNGTDREAHETILAALHLTAQRASLERRLTKAERREPQGQRAAKRAKVRRERRGVCAHAPLRRLPA